MREENPQESKAKYITVKRQLFWNSESVTQLCPTLSDPMDCSPPGSSVHGTSQARILEWVAIPFSRGSPQIRDQTQASGIAGRLWSKEESIPEGKNQNTCFWNAGCCWVLFSVFLFCLFGFYGRVMGQAGS